MKKLIIAMIGLSLAFSLVVVSGGHSTKQADSYPIGPNGPTTL